MHTDARTLADGTTLDADVCIVGAGAAGIPIALEFIGAGRRVLLLEGGGFDRDDALQARYAGVVSGQSYFPLEATRLHYFGGTTGHWGGFCAPLDPIDFRTRAWVSGSGWPFGAETLTPFYARAHPLLDLGVPDYRAATWQAADARNVPLPLDHAVMHEKIWQFSAPTRFGSRFRAPLVEARDVHLLTHAVVTELRLRSDGTAVETVEVRQADGRTLQVRGSVERPMQVVLACSTLQNVRLLLASNAVAAAGVGNAHDLVGRHFMEHLEMPVGTAVLLRPQSMHLYALDFGRTKARAELVASEAMQERLGLLNASLSLDPMPTEGEARSTFEDFSAEELETFRKDTRDGLTEAMRDSARSHDVESVRRQPRFALFTRQEQAPNAASRITLTRERDAFGVPRVDFHWALSARDRHTMQQTVRLLAREFGRLGIGRVQLRDWLRADDGPWPAVVSGGWHDIGGTRMHTSPREGVVDADCRVHGIANLSLAGAGVFPTAGAANPTLTIVALALRLAERLKRVTA
ncbi:MAG: GMC family oxidoreductase [Gemmatimonadetes bacterium]|nr:GMC family oxidoreductase [Gemmatimonadota bacterium]